MTETPEPNRRPFWKFETPSPRSSYCEMAEVSWHSQHTKNSDLVGVLEQVSELTMEDDAFHNANGLKTRVSLNPRPAVRPLPMLADECKQTPSPLFSDFKESRRSSPTTPSKLLTAPPLPSSPDLSFTGERRMIPPQFSPLGSSHVIDIHPLMQRRMREMEDEEMMVMSPQGYPPAAPPPTPQVVSLPPPMPWFETPEQTPRKKVALSHSLQMKKGPSFFQ